MSLSDKSQKYSGVQTRYCTVGLLKKQMSEEDLKTFEAVLTDDLVSAVNIYKALKDEGYKISEGVIRRHRRKECLCDPSR